MTKKISVFLILFFLVKSIFAQPPGKEKNPDWPCIQVYIEQLSWGSIWTGPVLDENSSKWINDEKLSSLAEKILKSFPSVDLILSPALGGIIIGYEIGRRLNKKAIFSERVEGKFQLRRGFSIKKDTKVLIVEDVITTGKSILECAKLVKKAEAKLLGFACIIDRSDKKNLLIKKNKIVSQVKISIPVYKKNELPTFLQKIPISTPGSRFLK